MARYQVTGRYHSLRDGRSWGPWEPGTQVDLSREDAAWINRDAPGILTPLDEAPEPQQEEKPARSKRTTADRRHRGAANRSAG